MWGRQICGAVYTGSLPFGPALGRFAFDLAAEAIHQLNQSSLTAPTNQPKHSAYIANYKQSYVTRAREMASRAQTSAACAGNLACLY